MKTKSPRSPKAPPSCCTFLKPGALAQIRYSKIAAKSRAKYAAKILALSQIKPTSGNPTGDVLDGFEEIPRFLGFKKKRYQPPRCLIRKKLVAGMPIFTES